MVKVDPGELHRILHRDAQTKSHTGVAVIVIPCWAATKVRNEQTAGSETSCRWEPERRTTHFGRLPTPNDRQLSTHPGSEPDSRLPANRGHLHARYPFKLLVAGGPLIEGILRRVMGPTKIHQALCRGGSVLRKRGGFYTEPAFNA